MTSELLPVDMQATTVIEQIDAPLAPDRVAADAPSAPSVIEVITPAATEVLTCPECGTSASVTVNRREASDFCRTCDYPLFWTPSRVYYDHAGRSADETLRRLPGTVGRATVASLACPHCAEPNALTALTCVRCGLLMHPVPELPEPEPVYAPPPPPTVYVEPEKGVAWWVWALLAFSTAVLITLLILILTHTIE